MNAIPVHDDSEVPGKLRLAVAAERLADGVHASTLWRWCRRGILAADGQRVKLRCIRVGGRVYTSAPWLTAFMLTLDAADTGRFGHRQPEGVSP